MAELTTDSTDTTSSCCSPAAQETCCEPSDKDACCGTAAVGGECGCAAGHVSVSDSDEVRERYAAAATAVAQSTSSGCCGAPAAIDGCGPDISSRDK